ncbi:unnamed protein product [Cunninghamella echinulata]
MTSLLPNNNNNNTITTTTTTTPSHYYATTSHYYHYPPTPVTQTISSVQFSNPSPPPLEPEMLALRTMLSAHRSLPYNGRRTCSTHTMKNNGLNNRLAYVEALVDTNALVIETMWCSNISPNRQAAVVPLRTFIQEVLKRSRTTYSTLQTALFYLFRSRPAITAHLQRSQQDQWEDAYISCGRRMFLASLVVASKFVQDKTYRNSAWAKIAGLPVSEINAAERIFLELVDYKLYISQPTFEQWHHLLHMHVEAKTQHPPSSSLLVAYDLPSSPISPTPFNSHHHRHHHHPFESNNNNNNNTSNSNHHHHLNLKRKREFSSSDHSYSSSFSSSSSSSSNSSPLSCSPSSTPMPVLTLSLPSSNHSSPLQTPTQISPIRCQLWKPCSPKKEN